MSFPDLSLLLHGSRQGPCLNEDTRWPLLVPTTSAHSQTETERRIESVTSTRMRRGEKFIIDGHVIRL